MVFQNFWKPYYNTPDSFDFTPLNPPASGGKHIRDVLFLISPVYGGIKGSHTKTVRTIVNRVGENFSPTENRRIYPEYGILEQPCPPRPGTAIRGMKKADQYS